MTAGLPPPATPFGEKVRTRLAEEIVVWRTTVDAGGTPQPNPVWFVWEGETVLVYNLNGAARISHIQARPRVALHFNNGDGHRDAVVLLGTAAIVDDVPSADEHKSFIGKYRDHQVKIGMDPCWYAETFTVPMRIFPTTARGM
ncbi:MAG TPA: TIGR03667 family PPOX class F420-dependent oxidoreductase [Solirubrobacteraceae bacterium]|jgi:PPOX class probable F420-dependent enzyme